MNPQEHIPGPEIKVRIKSDPGCWSVDGLNTLADGEYVFRQVAPDPEYIPSKPGGEAAAPLDVQDVEMVDRIVGATAILSTGRRINDAPRMEFDAARAAILSRLSSLRESVASLTRERDAARKALDMFMRAVVSDSHDSLDVDMEMLLAAKLHVDAAADVSPNPLPGDGYRLLVNGDIIDPSTDEVLVGFCLPWKPASSSYGTPFNQGGYWPMRRPVAADTGAV